MVPSTQAPSWATKEAWERYRPLIAQLYADNKLKEVMRVMERDHGFKATTKMYKNHFTMWGIDKNHKENEMRAVVRQNHLRHQQGKSSRFEIRGRPVEFADVVRYWKRKGVSVEEVLARRTTSLTPEAVMCFTPVVSPLSTPRELADPERILISIRDYFRGSFDSGTWVKTEPLFSCYSRKAAIASANHLNEIQDQLYLANNFFNLKRFSAAVEAINVAHSHIKAALQAEEPDTLLCIFYSISECLLVLGPEHPLGIVCGFLASLETIYWAELMLKAFESINVCLEAVLGPTHKTTLDYSRYRTRMAARTNVNQAKMKAKQALQTLETQLDPYDGRLAYLRLTLAEVLIIEQNYLEAEQVAQEMLSYAPPGKAGFGIRARGLYLLAFVHKIYGETFEAELKLRESIDTYLASGPVYYGLARAYLVTYAEWLTEWGCPDEADRVF
ncbi:ubiquitin carboxyl-terminal hydrolase 2 [Physcia stellaris]|nr:ubiquitin carboxyl-terminal hydrolase 2 [Physcia stellaris]